MWTICKREIRASIQRVPVIVYAAVMLLAFGILVFIYNISNGSGDLAYALFDSRYALLLAVPVLCMSSMSEDKTRGIEGFWRAMPVSSGVVVLGKYVAMLAVTLIPLAFMSVYVLLLSLFCKDPNLADAFVCIGVYFLMQAALVALCQFISSLTSNRWIALAGSILATAAMLFLPVLGFFLPDKLWISLVGFGILALAIGVATGFWTRNVFIGIAGGVVAASPVVVMLIVWRDALAAALDVVLNVVSPFYHFETTYNTSILNAISVVAIVAFAVLFVYMTVASTRESRVRR